MSVADLDGSTVTYGVKELLAEIRDSVTRVETKLDEKASKHDLDALTARVLITETDLMSKVTSVEQTLAQRVMTAERAIEAIKNRAIGASAVVALLGSVAGYVTATIT